VHLLPVDDAVFAVREDLHADRLRFVRTRGSGAEQHEYKAVPRSSKTPPIHSIGHHAITPRHSTTPPDSSRLSLGAPQHEIIDACLREVLKDRHPALNHNMLGVLAGALRLNLLLTTNFDDLLEQTFAEARNPLAVFEVHLGGGLRTS
jgi:hypothetical protein